MYSSWTWLAGSLFPVREVVIKGGEGLAQGALESAIAQFVPKGTGLLLFNGRGLTQRLEEESLVASAKIRRRLPSTVVVELVQREPAAIVKQGEGSWVCDAEGVVLRGQSQSKGSEAESHVGDDLPVIDVQGLAPGQFTPGRRVSDERLRVALDAVAFLRGRGPQSPRRVCFLAARGMEMELIGGARLRLGPPVRIEEKLGLCLAVLETAPESSRVSLVDVSCPDHSYYELEPR